MTEGWDRLEAMARTVELTGGLEARIPDPLWLLSRQWQVGEFRGDDAAQPAAVRMRRRSAPIQSLRGAGRDDAPVEFPTGRPLEAMAETTPAPQLGAAALHESARAGARLIRLLRDHGLASAVGPLHEAFGLTAPKRGVEGGGLGRAATALLAHRGIDGSAIARADPAAIDRALDTALTAGDRRRSRVVLAEWLGWYRRQGGLATEKTWDDERLEYTFSLGIRGPRGEVVLRAPEHTGEHLDWYTFDIAPEPAASHGLAAEDRPARPIAALPVPVRYLGMPASRWWEFEDSQVHFGDLESGPADLARLLVAEFATSFSVDWFVVPIAVPVGSLTELGGVEVIDTFGGRTPIPSTAAADHERTGGAERAWRLFELTGDELGDGHRSPWLFVPPSVAGGLDGPVLERVAFTRDEAANLAWGIEQLVEGPLGRAVERADDWYASAPEQPTSPTESVTGGATGDAWRYRLEAAAPPWWIPFVAERIDPAATAQVRLRRARAAAWALLGGSLVGPQSELLDRRRPRWLYEEEVPANGVRVERAWQLARWHDGSVHVWLRRRKRPGRPGTTSGVRWDVLDLPSQDA